MNPKDRVGRLKAPIHTVPLPVLLEVGVAMLEGARKYGPFNWRDEAISASVYLDAAFRHLSAWYEGEDIDPDSGVHHVTKAIAGLVILRDAIQHGSCDDDRPANHRGVGWQRELAEAVGAVHDRTPERGRGRGRGRAQGE